MCGFAGAVVWDERYRVSPATLARMSAAVAHRGPDGEGLRLTREHERITPDAPQVALAFRRLAILDTGVRSMQPFTDGRRWLVFNGEIYNFRDLRAELSDRNQWRTTGDTEVLLAAYAAWGERCVDRLNGMFAFAVWDEQERTLFLARDRMGQKPLYFAGMPDRAAGGWAALAFASEAAAVLRVPWVCRDVEPASLMSFLRWGCVTTPFTVFDGMNQLAAGTSLTNRPAPDGRASEIEGGRYFDAGLPPLGVCPADEAVGNPVAVTRAAVRAAVARQLISDVPVGCFLSGGVDSSAVAAAMVAAVGDPRQVRTFSVGFADPRYDERRHAAAVAAHLGTTHLSAEVRPDAAADLPKLAAAYGEPFADSSALPTFYLSRFARDHVKVALSGDGGDELFGGYDRYRAVRWAARLTGPAGRLAAAVGRRVPGGHPKGLASRGRRFLSPLGRPVADQYLDYVRLFPAALIDDLWPADHRGEMKWADESEEDLTRLLDRRRPVEAVAAYDRRRYLPDDLLTKVDRAAMLHGLEVRSPFMDPDVVTFAAGLTTDQLLKGGPKRMLREAFADDLPAWVFERKKMGFAVPVGDWFRGPLRAMLRNTLFSAHAFGRSHFDMTVVQRLVDEHEAGRVDHGQRLYALLMLELWWDTVRPTADRR